MAPKVILNAVKISGPEVFSKKWIGWSELVGPSRSWRRTRLGYNNNNNAGQWMVSLQVPGFLK
jgi:hypothetical protein